MAGQGTLTPYIWVRIPVPQPTITVKEMNIVSRLGSIYVITDKTNGKKYVGQTCRDPLVRFDEHCYDRRSTSKIHQAIQEKGVAQFELMELEKIPIEQLDERERYWIQTLNTFQDGYNSTRGGKGLLINTNYDHVLIKEKNLLVDSKEFLATLISNLTLWNISYLRSRLQAALTEQKEFFGYHLEYTQDQDLSPIDEVEDWIKTLNIKYLGKRIHCEELDMDFDTIAAAAQYLVEQGIYQGDSKTPIQSLVTSIGYNIHGKIDHACGLTFYIIPGSIKHDGGDFIAQEIYCPQLDKTFSSQNEAAQYMIDKQIWTGIKLKTAKLRISDMVRGAFSEYKGYTFQKVDKE